MDEVSANMSFIEVERGDERALVTFPQLADREREGWRVCSHHALVVERERVEARKRKEQSFRNCIKKDLI